MGSYLVGSSVVEDSPFSLPPVRTDRVLDGGGFVSLSLRLTKTHGVSLPPDNGCVQEREKIILRFLKHTFGIAPQASQEIILNRILMVHFLGREGRNSFHAEEIALAKTHVRRSLPYSMDAKYLEGY